MTLAEIEKLTHEYAAARAILKDHVDALEEEIAQLKRRKLPQIRRTAERAAEMLQALRRAVEESPELFERPRTVIFHGIRVGYMKGRGEIVWEDTSTVIKLIKKHFPDQVETLIKVTETPIKSALAQLSASDLKRIAVTVVESGDQVVIKPADSEIDRIVDAMLRDDEFKDAA